MVASIPNDIFQFSTHSALGNFNQGQPRTADLTSHGTEGIGVYEDGSLMILKQSSAYSINSNGNASPAPMSARLAFAMVTIFQPTHAVRLSSISLDGFIDKISSLESGDARVTNTLAPFKMETAFASLELEYAGGKSQTHGPINGTLFGYIVPEWMRSISGPRVHCLFIDSKPEGDSADRVGGRVKNFTIDRESKFLMAKCGRFHLGFPQSNDWEDVELA